MKTFLGMALAVAALLVVDLRAQTRNDCPRLGEQTIPAAHWVGPSVECGTGIVLQVGGAQVQGLGQGCPTFVHYVAAHDRPVAANAETYVERVGTAPDILFFMECRKSYLIFIPIGSYCAHVAQKNLADRLLLTTLPCPVSPADA